MLKLSAGERQRLGIARALLVENIIIISNDSQIEKYSDYELNFIH